MAVCCRDNKTGMLKGDALVNYLQGPSVKLAVTVMDGRQLRPGEGPVMTVQEAQFEQKGNYVAKKGGKKSSKKKLLKQKEELAWEGFDDVHKDSEARSQSLQSTNLCRACKHAGLRVL